jgi:hypothetical protein
LKTQVTEETSTAVETAATAETLASRDPRDETTALRKNSNSRTDFSTSDNRKIRRRQSTSGMSARIGGHSRDLTSTAERNTGTAGLKASQERAGTTGDANNSRIAKLVEMQ